MHRWTRPRATTTLLARPGGTVHAYMYCTRVPRAGVDVDRGDRRRAGARGAPPTAPTGWQWARMAMLRRCALRLGVPRPAMRVITTTLPNSALTRIQRRHLAATVTAVGGAGCAMALGLAESSTLPASLVVRCDGEGWSTCAKATGCCVTTLVGCLVFLYNETQKLMKTFALETVALGGEQIKLDDNQAEPANAKLVAALRGDKLFRERLTGPQQEAAAAMLLEELRLNFGLAILANKLKDMPENVSAEARKFLIDSREYDPSVPIVALLHAVGMFSDAVLQGQNAPPIWIAVYPWIQQTMLAVDTTSDGVVDFGEFADCVAHALSLVVSPPIPADTSELEALIQRAERMFAVVNHDARVTGGKGATISRATLTEWLRSMILLGVLPLDNIDRDLKSGSNTLLRRDGAHAGEGLAAIDQLTQQYCVELEIGTDDNFTFEEFSLVRKTPKLCHTVLLHSGALFAWLQVVDKLDFASWDVVAKDVCEELASYYKAQLSPDGSGLGVLLCSIAQSSLEAVGMGDSVTEQERLERAQSGLSR